MIFTLVGAAVIFYSFFDYKRSFIFYLAYKLLLVTNITLISIPGIPLLTLDMFITLFYILSYCFVVSKQNKSYAAPFPFSFPLLLISISAFLSAFFSLAGFTAELSSLIGTLSQNVLLFWLMWRLLETKEDYTLLFKLFTFLFFCSCLYGLFELMIQSNPLVQYEATLNKDPNKTINWSYSAVVRGYRIQSFFEHAIGAGINWAMYAIFVLYMYLDNKNNIPHRKLAYITALLCIPCIVFTRMRSPLVFILIAAIGLINFRKKGFYKLLSVLLVVGIVFLPLFSDNADIFMSLFNSSSQEKVMGSSLEQRLQQFTAAFSLMSNSPILGLGTKYATVLYSSSIKNLLGGESIWLTVIVDYGIFGVLSYGIMAYYSIIKLPRKFNSKMMFFFALAYWITNTVTSVPGMHLYLYYLLLIYFIKTSSNYNEHIHSRLNQEHILEPFV